MLKDIYRNKCLWSFRLLSLGIFLCSGLIPFEGYGKRYTLDEVLQMAARSSLIDAARYKLRAYEERLREAKWAPFFNFDVNYLISPVPELRGSAIRAEQGDISFSSKFGLLNRLEIQGGIPVYTFGKLTSVRELAKEGIEVARSELLKKRQEISFQVKKAFYSIQLAREILYLIEEGRKHLKKAMKKVKEELETGEGESTEIDLHKLRTVKAEIDLREIEARKLEILSLSALRTLCRAGPNFDIIDEPLKKEKVKIGSLSEYLEKARLLRPEIRMLRAGVRLRYAKLKLERSQFWPDFLIVGTFGWAHSEAVDDQRNPFVKDEFNFLRAGIGALLRLKLDFPIDWFKTRRAKAELEETLLLEKYALQGIGLEIEKAWIEAKKAEERIKAAQKGQKAARAWLVSVSQGFAAGLTEIKDVTEALVAFFKTKLSYIKAIYDFNIASISLTFAVGGE